MSIFLVKSGYLWRDQRGRSRTPPPSAADPRSPCLEPDSRNLLAGRQADSGVNCRRGRRGRRARERTGGGGAGKSRRASEMDDWSVRNGRRGLGNWRGVRPTTTARARKARGAVGEEVYPRVRVSMKVGPDIHGARV